MVNFAETQWGMLLYYLRAHLLVGPQSRPRREGLEDSSLYLFYAWRSHPSKRNIGHGRTLTTGTFYVKIADVIIWEIRKVIFVAHSLGGLVMLCSK